jgi:DNA-binding NarL/FixJ family response regulator
VATSADAGSTSPLALRTGVSGFLLKDAAAEQLSALTTREIDVFRLVAQGLSNVEVARELVVEENTVKTHVSRILTKLNLRDRVQAGVLAYESGFITPDPGGTAV